MNNKLTNNKWYFGLFQFGLIFALSGCNFIEGIFYYQETESPNSIPLNNEQNNDIESPENVGLSPMAKGEMAKLTPNQIKQLNSLDKTEISRDGTRKHTFRVVVPTYVPHGFEVIEFNTSEDIRHGHSYEIRYRNPSNNICFSIKADNGQWGGPVSEFESLEVSSPALNKVQLMYSGYDSFSNLSLFFRKDLPSPGSSPKTAYSFQSIAGSQYLIKDYQCEFSLSLQEATKVIESLIFLNP